MTHSVPVLVAVIAEKGSLAMIGDRRDGVKLASGWQADNEGRDLPGRAPPGAGSYVPGFID